MILAQLSHTSSDPRFQTMESSTSSSSISENEEIQRNALLTNAAAPPKYIRARNEEYYLFNYLRPASFDYEDLALREVCQAIGKDTTCRAGYKFIRHVVR